MNAYRSLVMLFAFLFMGIGIALVVVTADTRRGGIRLPDGSAVLRPRRRPPLSAPQAALTSAGGTQAAPASAGSRRSRALLDRVRGDRLVDLLRARNHHAARARLHAARAARDRPALPDRLAVLRRRHSGNSRDRRRRDVRPDRVQRLLGLHHGLGALPRLPDRHRPVGPVHAPLRRGRVLHQDPPSVGRRGRLRRDRGSRGDPARPPHPSAPLGLYGRPRRSRHPAPDRGARDGAPVLAGRTQRGDVSRDVAHVALARVRDPARDARLYRARNRCEPRRGDAASRPRPTAESVRLHRPGRRPVRRDRRRRALGVSGGARHAARQQLDPCTARRHRHADPCSTCPT